jgi:hypothetical protein
MEINLLSISLVALVVTSLLAFVAALARWSGVALIAGVVWFIALAAFSFNRWAETVRLEFDLPLWSIPLWIAFLGALLAALIFRARFTVAVGVVILLITVGVFMAY